MQQAAGENDVRVEMQRGGPEAVRALLDEALRAGVGSAYAFSVGSSDGPVHRGVAGTDRYEGQAVTDDSFWDIASLTKIVVGTGYARLVEDGALHLGQPVEYFLSDFRGTPSGPTTIRDLLCHTAGLAGQQKFFRYCRDLDSIRTAASLLPLRQRPGTSVEYCSVGFMMLGWIIEAVTDDSLPRALDELVLRPFGMATSHFRATDAAPDGTVSTEHCPWRGELVHGVVHDENAWVMGGAGGQAGLFSPLPDLERFAMAWLRAHRGIDNSLLLKRSAQVWAGEQVRDRHLVRGLAWQLASDGDAPTGDLLSPTAFGHTGFTGTSLYIDPELDLYGILLTNRVHPSRSDDRIGAVRNRFYNLAAGAAAW